MAIGFNSEEYHEVMLTHNAENAEREKVLKDIKDALWAEKVLNDTPCFQSVMFRLLDYVEIRLKKEKTYKVWLHETKRYKELEEK